MTALIFARTLAGLLLAVPVLFALQWKPARPNCPGGIARVTGTRRRQMGKLHWAPMLIAVFFGALLVSMVMQLLVSSHGLPDRLSGWLLPNQDRQRLHTAAPGVIPHDQNKLYEAHMKKMAEQRNLGWQVELAGLDHLPSGTPGKITVNVRDAEGKPLPADRVELALSRVANSRDDRRLTLRPLAAGAYGSEILFPAPGRWLIGVTVTRGQDSFTAQRSLIVGEPDKK